MNRLLLKPAADNIMDSIDGNEGVLVLVEHDFLEFIDFQARDHAVEHFLALPRVAAGTMQQCNAAPQPVIEGRGYLIMFIRDNHRSVIRRCFAARFARTADILTVRLLLQ